MTRILVAGSYNTDMVIRLDRLPRPGETLLGGEFGMGGGGKGANQAIAAARAGGDVAFVGCLGADTLGDEALAALTAEGIDTSGCRRDATAPSGVAQILVAANGENCIAVAPGANALLSPTDICSAAALFSGAAAILLQLETPLDTVLAALETARRHHCYTVLNPAPARELPATFFPLVDLITPNETEAESLTGVTIVDNSDAEQAARALHARGVRHVIITRGSAGVTLSRQSPDGQVSGCHRPAFAVTALDTTAAGDVFNGCLVARLAAGQDLADAIPFAQAASAMAVQRVGAQDSIPRHDDIRHFLAERSC